MRSALPVLVLVGCGVLVAGCYPKHLVTTAPAHPPPFEVEAPATLIFPALTSPATGKATSTQYARLTQHLTALFGDAGVRAMEERDVTGAPSERSWVVRIQLLTVRDAGSSLVPEFEVSVFDASLAPVERVATESAGIVLMVDTSGRPPIMRRTYEIEMEVDYGTRASEPDEQSAFDTQYCEVLAALLYAEIAGDIASAIRTAPPYVQDVTSTTSGSDAVMPAH